MLLTYASCPMTCPAYLWVSATQAGTHCLTDKVGERYIGGRLVAVYRTLSGMFAAL